MPKVCPVVACAGLAIAMSVAMSVPADAQPGDRPDGRRGSPRPDGAPRQDAAPAGDTPPDAPAQTFPAISPVRSTIGTASNGQAIEVWTLGAPGNDQYGRTAEQRPAVLVVAGLQGHHTVGVRTAQGVAQRLGAEHPELLQERTVFVIPQVALGADAWVAGADGPRVESGRLALAGDADHDGRMSEDPPEDLNGDGMITQMRVRTPDARWGLTANLIPSPDEPRLMRAAKASDGEVGQWAVLTEGIDNDGDGRFNEDAGGALTGGTDLAMNFPTLWPEHEDGAGIYPLSSPEALAVVRWVQAHDNILAVVVYDPHDTLINIPATGQYGPEGAVPRGLEEGDKPYFQHVADAFKRITHMTGAPTGQTAGSLASWAYADFGVLTFSTPVWVRPDLIKQEQAGEGGDNAAQGAGDHAGDDAPPDPAARAAAEKERLMAEGYPERMAEFLAASPDQRRAIIQRASTMTEQEQQALMAEMMSLSPAQQQRLMEAAREAGLNMGGPRGGPPAGGGPPPGGPPAQDHQDAGLAPLSALSSVDAIRATVLGLLAQPAGGGQPGGGRRFGGGGGPGGLPGGGRPGGPGGGRGGAGVGESSGEDAKWLAYSDEHRDHAGFVEWTPFDHPQLGQVEIGGFVPGFRLNPPEEEMERLISEQTSFIAELLPMLPDITLDALEQEQVGAGLWRVRARVSNAAYLPTCSSIGLKARRVMPIVVAISTDIRRILTGQRVTRVNSLDGSGGSSTSEWLIQGAAGDEVTVEVRSDVFGTRTQTIRLGAGEGRADRPGGQPRGRSDGQTGGGR